MERWHLCKKHHLECVNIPETVNTSIWLCFSFPFFKAFCMNKLLYKLERTRSSSQQVVLLKSTKTHKLAHNYNSWIWINLHQWTSEYIFNKAFLFKIIKHCLDHALREIKHLVHAWPRALFCVNHSQQCFNILNLAIASLVFTGLQNYTYVLLYCVTYVHIYTHSYCIGVHKYIVVCT